ncbi:MAG TPA: serine/threonine-protein kinase [Pyrinomonadaceae bacterium]|jgi:serine/threonine protein kinase
MRELEYFIGEVLDEKYRLDRLLGRGGMGAVYLATHLGTERPVALKIITPQLMTNDEFVERFKREARAAGRLRHPNVVDVTDFGFAHVGEERVAYLVMEYLDGCTLADVLAEEERLPLDWVVDILEQVCSAVDEAHQQGIVHRDLKPDNIWLEPNRLGGYRVKVLDFGIAKLGEPASATATTNVNREALPASSSFSTPSRPSAEQRAPVTNPEQEERAEAATHVYTLSGNEEAQTRKFPLPETVSAQPNPTPAEADTLIQPTDPSEVERTRLLEHRTAGNSAAFSTAPASDVTRVGAILGTPLYMSPEQCRGQQLDARSDIYSLGVVAYQMLAGETPFGGDTLSVMKMHTEALPPPLKLKNKKVSKRVAHHVMSALAKDPAQRPASAAAFSSALRANAEGAGTLLRRGLTLYTEHFPKFLRLALLSYAPVLFVTFLQIVMDILRWQKALPRPLEIIFSVVIGLLTIIANFLSASVIAAVTVVVVIQLTAAPLKPIDIRASFGALKRRWKPFLRTSLRVTMMIMLGFLMLFIGAFFMMMRYALWAPVVLIEGLEKSAAIKRTKELVRRSRRTVIFVLLIQLSIPMFIGWIVGWSAAGAAKGQAHLSPRVLEKITPIINLFITPLFSIMTALLYLKARQLGGESLKQSIDQLENEEMPRSRWQQRMRSRLTMRTPSSR